MSELPSTYKACVYDEPGKISTKVVDLDMPEPGPGEVLINLFVSSNSVKHPNAQAKQGDTN
jgi:NADPH:quinone reductase-like Zn-dependent oxidoreductase